MRILVCVKRVPAPGSKINITADGQRVDDANLGHTTSPHEECAVEAASQLIEEHGGEALVLTLGGIEAEALQGARPEVLNEEIRREGELAHGGDPLRSAEVMGDEALPAGEAPPPGGVSLPHRPPATEGIAGRRLDLDDIRAGVGQGGDRFARRDVAGDHLIKAAENDRCCQVHITTV